MNVSRRRVAWLIAAAVLLAGCQSGPRETPLPAAETGAKITSAVKAIPGVVSAEGSYLHAGGATARIAFAILEMSTNDRAALLTIQESCLKAIIPIVGKATVSELTCYVVPASGQGYVSPKDVGFAAETPSFATVAQRYGL